MLEEAMLEDAMLGAAMHVDVNTGDGFQPRPRTRAQAALSILRWNAVIPLVLAAHLMGWTKAELRGSIYITDRTTQALGLNDIFSANAWLLLPFAIALTTLSLTLRPPRHAFTIRLLAYVAVSLPLFWYAREMMYLGGKLLVF